MSTKDPWEGKAYRPDAGGNSGPLMRGPNLPLMLVIVVALAGLVSFLVLVENPFAPQTVAGAATTTTQATTTLGSDTTVADPNASRHRNPLPGVCRQHPG